MGTPKQPSGAIDIEAPNWSQRIRAIMAQADDQHPIVHRTNFNKFVEVHPAASWSEVQTWLACLQGKWIYRGQTDARWSLLTSLERDTTKTVTLTGSGMKAVGDLRLTPQSSELKLLQEFQRSAHQYRESVPDMDDIVGWLALMQHFGAPTRLLDWTYSPYVALYFALEKATSDSGHALWAIASDRLTEASNAALREHHPDFVPATDFRARCEQVNRAILFETNPSIVILANPIMMNERVAAQQGLFLSNLSHVEEEIALNVVES